MPLDFEINVNGGDAKESQRKGKKRKKCELKE